LAKSEKKNFGKFSRNLAIYIDMKTNLNEQLSHIKKMMGVLNEQPSPNETFDSNNMVQADESSFYNDDDEVSEDKKIKNIFTILKYGIDTKDWEVVQQAADMLEEFQGEHADQDDVNHYQMPGFEDTMDNLDKLSIRK
jgi:hypothetical protein